MKTSAIFALLAGFLSTPALAQGPIEGAFGQKLGAIFEPGDMPNEGEAHWPNYRVTPEKPFKGLTDYSVEVSPRTHRIHSIHATGRTRDEAAAREIVTMLDIILREKYANDPPVPLAESNAPGRGSSFIRRSITHRGGRFGEMLLLEQRGPARSVEVFAQTLPPQGPLRIGEEPSPWKATVHLYYRDAAAAAEAHREAAVIRDEKEVREKAEQAKQAEAAKIEYEKQQAAAAQQRAEERARLKQEAAKLDTSGL